MGVALALIAIAGVAGCSPAASDAALTPRPTATDSLAEVTSINRSDPAEARCMALLPGASDPDEAGCGTHFDPYADLTFDDDLHRAWYGRFWTGSCEGVGAFCLPGVGWYQTIDTLLARLQATNPGYVQNRLWALGRAVGFDWARDNQVGSISTGDLQRWGQLLDTAQSDASIRGAIEAVEQEVCTRLGAEVLAGDYATTPACRLAGA